MGELKGQARGDAGTAFPGDTGLRGATGDRPCSAGTYPMSSENEPWAGGGHLGPPFPLSLHSGPFVLLMTAAMEAHLQAAAKVVKHAPVCHSAC